MKKEEFIKKIAPIIIAENELRGNPLFSSVVIAQGCLETGYGKSNLMVKANAIFGIKATKQWKGKCYNSKTKECYNGKDFTVIDGSFRAYDSLEEGITDYFNLICKNSRYRKACVTNTPKECIQAIKDGGYATDPKYVDSIMKIITQNNLTIYDRQEKQEQKSDYKVGNIYTLQVNLNVRRGASEHSEIKKYSELTKDGRKHALNQANAVLKRGTKVSCLDLIIKDNETWFKIPSGYICANYKGKVYIK